MPTTSSHLLALEDLLGDLQHARRTGDLGRLALLVYCEVRPWARRTGQLALADDVAHMVMTEPHATREEFLADVDRLIERLQQLRAALLAMPLAS